jgi:hypothetical protein
MMIFPAIFGLAAKPSMRAAKLRAGGAVLFCLALTMPLVPRAEAQTTSLPITIADFNHDGIPDALVFSTTSPTATIALGSVPYGTFTGAGKAVTFPAGCTSLSQGSIAVGDFNGDGFPDIVFVCANIAGVMLGNGDGTFGAASNLAGVAGGVPLVGDFNDDGKLDIAVLGTFAGNNGSSQYIQFLAGNGDGTFNEAVLSNLAQNGYSAPVVADVNGDGYPDIILGSFNTDSDTATSINVFGNNKNGTFGTSVQNFFTPSTSANVPISAASSILTGNFFGNGVTDFVVPDNGSSPGLFLISNTSTATSYSLATPLNLAYRGLQGAMAGTFTGSGTSDVVVANGTSLTVLANDGTGNLSASYGSLTIASTTSVFAVADANGDRYSDIYTATLSQAGALQLAVGLTSGSATATSQPLSLPIGTQAISATWPGNVNFTGATPTGNQIVVGVPSVTAVTSNKNPALVGDAVTFTVVVAPSTAIDRTPSGTVVLTDGTATLATGTLDGSGSFTYTTSALTQATHPIEAMYAGDAYFAASVSAVLSQVVNGLSVSSITPTTATLGAGATTITVTGSGFVATTVVQVNGTTIPTTLVSPTVLTAVIPAADLLTVGTLQISVVDPSIPLTTVGPPFTVTAPAVSASLTGPPTTPPGTEPTVSFTVNHPYPVDLTVTLTLGFASSTTPQITNDPEIQFAGGGTTLTFVVPANTTTVPAIQLQAGTVAGTITIPITLTAGGVNVTPADLAPLVILVPPAVPSITGMTVVSRTGNQLTVAIHGFSNTREMVTAAFHFTAASGADLGTSDLSIQAGTIFANWYTTAESDTYGSAFTYTQIFTTSDAATNVGTVQVTLTNTVGASTPATAQ